MSFLSQPKPFKLKNTYIHGFLDCSGYVILNSGNLIIGNTTYPGYNANQLSLLVNGRTEMNGNVIVNGRTDVNGNVIVNGRTEMNGNVTVNSRTEVNGNVIVNGRTEMNGNLTVNSQTEMNGNVIVNGRTEMNENLTVNSQTEMNGNVIVNGRTEVNGNVIINGNLFVSSNNIALGLRAGNITNGIQDGLPNGLNTTAVGSFSGMNHSGINNIFIGSVAGQTSSTTYFSRTGSNNTYVGYRTSANNSAWANSTAVGTGAVITASNQIVLGTATETVFAPGNVIVGGDISCNGNVLFTYAPRLSYTNVPGYTVNNIGYSTTTTGTGTLATAFNALSSINTIGVSIPVVGVWLINYKGSINTASSGSVGGGTIGFGLSTTASNTGNTIALGTTRTASTPGAVGAAYTASSNIYSLHGTHIYIGASTTIYLNCNITTIAALAAASCSLTLTRIA